MKAVIRQRLCEDSDVCLSSSQNEEILVSLKGQPFGDRKEFSRDVRADSEAASTEVTTMKTKDVCGMSGVEAEAQGALGGDDALRAVVESIDDGVGTNSQ